MINLWPLLIEACPDIFDTHIQHSPVAPRQAFHCGYPEYGPGHLGEHWKSKLEYARMIDQARKVMVESVFCPRDTVYLIPEMKGVESWLKEKD